MAREAGIPNKNKRGLLARLKQQYGEDFHPIMRMAENAVKLEDIAKAEPDAATVKAALDGWEKIAQYTEPKLKSIEVKAEVSTKPMLVDLSGGDLTLALATDRDKDDE